MKPISQSMLPLAVLGLTAATAQGATIVYNFNSTTTAWTTGPHTSPVDSNDFGSGVTASNYTFTRGGAREIAIVDGMTKAKQTAGPDTHQFTITIPDLGGGTVDLTQLSFDYGINYEPGAWTVGVNQGTPAQTSDSFAGSGNTGFVNKHYDIALAGLTGLNNTTVTFTITDNAGGNNKNTTLYSYFDNVTVTGAVFAVPEPSAAALLGLASLGLIRRRRPQRC